MTKAEEYEQWKAANGIFTRERSTLRTAPMPKKIRMAPKSQKRGAYQARNK